MNRRGLTLFEIAVSLAIAAIGVVVVLALLPVGLRVQERARFQVLASAQLVDLLASFQLEPTENYNVDGEGRGDQAPWEVVTGRQAMGYDLEHQATSLLGSLLPLPTRIARRLDSDGDEIRRLLADGARLYYPNPRAGNRLNNRSQGFKQLPSELGRLVVGIVGPAQQNTIPAFPWKAWPYYQPYPSHPIQHEVADPDVAQVRSWRVVDASLSTANQTGGSDPYNDLFTQWTHASSTRPLATPPVGFTTWEEAVRAKSYYYVAIALWFAQRVALPSALYDGTATPADIEAATANPVWVNAARYLAHAGMTLTRHHERPALVAGVDIPAYAFQATGKPAGATTTPAATITEARILAWHEVSLALAMAYAAARPYDWGAPRPLNRAIMTDMPLLQWDLWPEGANPALQGQIPGTSGFADARMWRPLSAAPVTNAGWSMASTNAAEAIPAEGAAGSPWSTRRDHFTLARAFHPGERCRQVVVWAVDWLGYEDCETAPSATVDASRYPVAQVYTRNIGANRRNDEYFGETGSTTPIDGTKTLANPPKRWGRMNFTQFQDRNQRSFRNPEKHFLFYARVDDLPTGADVSPLVLDDDISQTATMQFRFNEYDWAEGIYDQGTGIHYNLSWQDATKTTAASTLANYAVDGVLYPRAQEDARLIFSGCFGADRNNNRRLDRGPIPADVRLRATTVARFVVYDPRLPLHLR